LQLRQKLWRDLALHHRVERVIAMAISGPFPLPPFDCPLHAIACLDECEIDDRRRAAVERGAAELCWPVGQMVLGDAGHDDRPPAMHMRINSPGYNNLPRGVDDTSGGDPGKAAGRTYSSDARPLDCNIGWLRTRRKNGDTARDDDVEHMGLLSMRAR